MASKTSGKFFSNLHPASALSRFLLKAFGVLAFCTVSGYALFLAYGYNVNLQHRDIEKTSIIDVASTYPQVRLYLDDKIIGNSLPFQIKNLLPGFYNLAVDKLGYLPWSRKLEVQADIVTKVDDVVLVPEHVDQFFQQLVHFPAQSRYFWSKDFLIVSTPGQNYLTLVYFMEQGTIKEQELQLSRRDLQNVQIYTPQGFLVTFADNSYEWVEPDGPRLVAFNLPKGAAQLTFLPSQNAAFFVDQGNLYRLPVDSLPNLTAKTLTSFVLTKNVDQFDVHDGKLVYLNGGMAYSADDQGKNIRLIDRSHTITYIRYVPLLTQNGGLFVVRNAENKRLLYVADGNGISSLLTPQLKGDVYQDVEGRILFSDESGNIFLYKSLLQKKTLVTTLPTDFALLGFIFDDGHFLFVRQQQVLLGDSSFTNVYPFFDFEENARYFVQSGAVFFLNNDKLRSLFFLPRN